jgi:hypothetical protein
MRNRSRQRHHADSSEGELLALEWPMLTPIQRVQRVAMAELRSAEEWLVVGDIFRRRGMVLEFREAA